MLVTTAHKDTSSIFLHPLKECFPVVGRNASDPYVWSVCVCNIYIYIYIVFCDKNDMHFWWQNHPPWRYVWWISLWDWPSFHKCLWWDQWGTCYFAALCYILVKANCYVVRNGMCCCVMSLFSLLARDLSALLHWVTTGLFQNMTICHMPEIEFTYYHEVISSDENLIMEGVKHHNCQ
jgi:hypothetical protein